MKDRIRKLVYEVAHKAIPISKITDTANLADELGFDSLMFVTLVSAMEKEFKVKIAPGDINLDNFKNVETIMNLLNTKIE